MSMMNIAGGGRCKKKGICLSKHPHVGRAEANIPDAQEPKQTHADAKVKHNNEITKQLTKKV